jgi:Protein of unknown function, DUF417
MLHRRASSGSDHARGLVEQSGHRRRKAGMTGQRKEPSRRAVRLAGEPQQKRKHRRRQRVQHRAAAQAIIRRLAPHQRDEACKLRGNRRLSAAGTGMHDQARRQIVAQQAIATVTIIPSMPEGWDVAAGGFPAMTGNVPFLVKDVVLLAVSLYLLRQDAVRRTQQ